MFNWFKKPQHQNYRITKEQHNQIVNEYIRQIQLGYKVKIAIGTVSAVFTFGSVALFYTGRIEQAHLTMGISVISNVVGFKSANDSKKELKEMLQSCEIVNNRK
ncbi:MAG: hypothetical protein HEQ24_23315 [Dolichospermum sp. BR01]|nr:hypothetical protein [Dolichospermum sp. BR01]